MNCRYCKKQIKEKFQGKTFCSARCKKKMKEYYQRPEVKARQKEYYKRPEIKARLKEYYKRPEVKTRIREYQRTEKCKKKMREYYQRPEIKAKQREYNRNHVHPSQAKLDFFKHYPARKFRNKEEFYETVKTYSENVCSIEGICEQIQSNILLESKEKIGYNELQKKLNKKKNPINLIQIIQKIKRGEK